MNIPIKAQLPVELVIDLNQRVDELAAVHAEQRARFLRSAKTGGDPDKIMQEQDRLREQERRLSIQHVVRLCVEHGWPAVKAMKPEALLLRLMQDRIVVGRPRRGASVA